MLAVESPDMKLDNVAECPEMRLAKVFCNIIQIIITVTIPTILIYVQITYYRHYSQMGHANMADRSLSLHKLSMDLPLNYVNIVFPSYVQSDNVPGTVACPASPG